MTKTMAAPQANTVDKNIQRNDLVNQVFAEVDSLSHGIVTLEIHVRDGRLIRAVVSRSRSMMIEGGAQ